MNTPELRHDENPDRSSRPRLLLADDSVTIRRVVELTFADEGIDVTTAADATSAMEKFVEVQPDIVLVDVGLPGTSGYQICEMIKQDEATRQIPVLLLVGSFEPFDQDQAERVGADGFLTKPFQSIRELVSRVSELLSPAGQSDQKPLVDETGEASSGLPGSPGAEDDLVGSASSAEAVLHDVSDIDDLLESSFANTAEIEEFDTVDDLLGDAGLDDELIETSYQPDEIQGSKDAGEKRTQEAVPTKDFSWSPAETIDTGSDAADETQPTDGEVSFDKTLSDFGQPDESPTIDPSVQRTETAEPSPEFIAIVAQRVVEKLSDKAVRDIAKEAVPRIAEKLIREALAEEKKT